MGRTGGQEEWNIKVNPNHGPRLAGSPCIFSQNGSFLDLLSVPKGAEKLCDELVGAAQHDALLAEHVLLLLRLHDVLSGRK